MTKRFDCINCQVAGAQTPAKSMAVTSAAVQTSTVTPIYDMLQASSPYPLSAENRKCIEDTVKQLLDNGPHAEEPGLLLGYVQGGKTATYEYIVALCCDKGIDTIVFLTKGTNALALQTISRLQKDFVSLPNPAQTL